MSHVHRGVVTKANVVDEITEGECLLWAERRAWDSRIFHSCRMDEATNTAQKQEEEWDSVTSLEPRQENVSRRKAWSTASTSLRKWPPPPQKKICWIRLHRGHEWPYWEVYNEMMETSLGQAKWREVVNTDSYWENSGYFKVKVTDSRGCGVKDRHLVSSFCLKGALASCTRGKSWWLQVTQRLWAFFLSLEFHSPWSDSQMCRVSIWKSFFIHTSHLPHYNRR